MLAIPNFSFWRLAQTGKWEYEGGGRAELIILGFSYFQPTCSNRSGLNQHTYLPPSIFLFQTCNLLRWNSEMSPILKCRNFPQWPSFTCNNNRFLLNFLKILAPILSTVDNAVCQLLLKHTHFSLLAKFNCQVLLSSTIAKFNCQVYGLPSLIAAKCLQSQLHHTATSQSWKIFARLSLQLPLVE